MNEYIPSLQIGASTQVHPQATTATIAAFSLTNTNLAYSTILAEYDLPNTAAISIRLPMQRSVRVNRTFALAVRFQNEDGDIVRYVIHRPDGMTGLLYPAYAGEAISGTDPVIEVWGVAGQGTAAILEDITLTVKTFSFQSGGMVSICGQFAGEAWTLTPTTFIAVPTGPTNPFADSLMLARGS